MKKKITIMIILIVVALAILIVLILGLRESPKANLIGIWTTDGVTIYEFDRNNKGKLVVSVGEFPFTYKINADTLEIDFENEKSTDSKYTYKFDDNKLILNGDNGTFTFIKKEWEKRY